MNKLIILLICVMFVVIIAWPVDLPVQDTRHDWGGSYPVDHCIHTLKWTQVLSFNLQTNEVREYWKWTGGCSI